MIKTSYAVAAVALAIPMLSGAAEAKTSYQLWAQGQGAYVSSTDHPPGGIQSFLVGEPYGYAPPPPYGYRYRAPPPPPYGYDYGDAWGDPAY